MQPSSELPEAGLWAGAARADLTPQGSVFLYGYPHVRRMSTGVHDHLEAAALYLRQGTEQALFIANDLISVDKALVGEVRRRVSTRTGLPANVVAITATHTHSGPVMVNYVSNRADRVIPAADPAYLEFVTGRMVEAACAAFHSAVPAEAGLAEANARGAGTNRHDPSGPSDPSVPVLLVRARQQQRLLACMVVYAMHPTVLHEDSTLISGDFPHFARQYLRECGLVPAECPILYHNGASGNQSPRHVTKTNTFAEARRLGEMLGEAIAAVFPTISFDASLAVRVRGVQVSLEARTMPSVRAAQAWADQTRQHFESLRREGADRTAIRTAECDWFGAEETVVLARAAVDGRLAQAAAACLPAEIQLVQIGSWNFVFWPGEFFVEYALNVKTASPRTFVVTLANGVLQGYIVTREAATRGVYEATNAIFSADNGHRVVQATLALLKAAE